MTSNNNGAAAVMVGRNPQGHGFKTTDPPKRNTQTGVISFQDQPTFRPNLTPEEVLRAGAFGGGYFRDIYSGVLKEKLKGVWKELPAEWIKGLDVKTRLASTHYDPTVNKYKVDCGAKAGKEDSFGLSFWETSNWINAQDPYGWFQWYCRFYQGRRSDDDARQVSRWAKCAGVTGRWRNNLVTKCVTSRRTFDDSSVSPVVRQTLLHWAYELSQADFDAGAKRVAARKQSTKSDTTTATTATTATTTAAAAVTPKSTSAPKSKRAASAVATTGTGKRVRQGH